jgi:hypothetical protein
MDDGVNPARQSMSVEEQSNATVLAREVHLELTLAQYKEQLSEIKALEAAVTEVGGSADPELGVLSSDLHGARFSTEIDTRGCHWFPRLLV